MASLMLFADKIVHVIRHFLLWNADRIIFSFVSCLLLNDSPSALLAAANKAWGSEKVGQRTKRKMLPLFF